ncbi:UNVERIFIED_ORG: hypothetical protein J2X79_002380 [Arthrobacter globiformis]|nr:hypothetical protein [Arthrobacter globiformis]
MNPAGRASDPSAVSSPRTLRRLIAARPVAAFMVIATALTWVALILSIAVPGNAVPGILAELLILLGTAVLVTRAVLGNIWEELTWTRVVQRRLLIVALLHASFNASEQSKLAVFDGAWQQIAAATVLLVVLALLRKFRTLTAESGHGAAVAG